MPAFVWRKHASLHQYMQRLSFQFGYRKKSVRNHRDEFNCNPMLLDEDAVNCLEAAIKGDDLPTRRGSSSVTSYKASSRPTTASKISSSANGRKMNFKPRNRCATIVGDNVMCCASNLVCCTQVLLIRLPQKVCVCLA